MLIAHLPAGFLCTRFLLACFKTQISTVDRRRYFRIGLLASILPDFDAIYYYLRGYLYGQWSPTHHAYWSHTPFYGLIMLLIPLLYSLFSHKRGVLLATSIGGANLCLHFILDSFASKIKWLYPLSHKAFGLFGITPHYRWWVWNFVFHPTFYLELMIVTIALYVLMRDWRIQGLRNIRDLATWSIMFMKKYLTFKEAQ